MRLLYFVHCGDFYYVLTMLLSNNNYNGEVLCHGLYFRAIKATPKNITLFCKPKDAKWREVWVEVFHRKDLTDKHFAYNKHFNEENIIRLWQSDDVQVSYYLLNNEKQNKQYDFRISVTSIF